MPAEPKLKSLERRRGSMPRSKKITWRGSVPKVVFLREVGPRDGFQNEVVILPALTKLALIRSLVDAGQSLIEAVGFADPETYPQLADAEDVARQLPRRDDVTYSAWVEDSRGMERALVAGIGEVAIGVAASDGSQRHATKQTTEERIGSLWEIVALARKHRLQFRGVISSAFVCPFEGKIDPRRVVEIAGRLFDLGCYEIAISDTTGRATPKMVWKVFDRLLKKAPASAFAGHFHDTYGMAISNILAAAGADVRVFETSIGGLGVCPHAAGAPANVATEDVVYVLEGMGIRTNLTLEKLIQTSGRIERFLNHAIASRVYQAERHKPDR
ncbi:MAG: hydroxymethylglutaryl-CoA lyase [Pseudomonadota bacterium]